MASVPSALGTPVAAARSKRQPMQQAGAKRAAVGTLQRHHKPHRCPHRLIRASAAGDRQLRRRQRQQAAASAADLPHDDGSPAASLSLYADLADRGGLFDANEPNSSENGASDPPVSDLQAAQAEAGWQQADSQANVTATQQQQQQGGMQQVEQQTELQAEQQLSLPPQQQQQVQEQEQEGQPWPLRWQLPAAPWALNTTITLMMLWLLCFWAAAYTLVPTLLRWAGVEAAATSAASASGASSAAAAEAAAWVQVVRHLVLDALQVATTVLLLRRGLRGYHPRRLGLFAAPLRPLRRWLLPVAAGVATFPFIDWVYKRMVELLAAAEEPVVSSTADQILGTSSWATQALWFGVLAVCAPLWEELMFRGFLLPSLARYLPRWATIVATSLIFALVHFSRDGLLPLLLLGCVFGASYAYTRNLLAPIVLHSLWNVGLLVQLLTAGGGAV